MAALQAARSLARALRSPDGRADLRFEVRRRLSREPRLSRPDPDRILVVCHGNLCRSPFAAALLQNGLREMRVSSCGLAAAKGHPADATALQVAQEFGLELTSHRTTPFDAARPEGAGWIFAFEGHHVQEIARRLPGLRDRVFLLGDFLAEPPYRIADPWGQPKETFRAVFTRIEQAVHRVAHLHRTGAA